MPDCMCTLYIHELYCHVKKGKYLGELNKFSTKVSKIAITKACTEEYCLERCLDSDSH